jgi:hypothetical protein
VGDFAKTLIGLGLLLVIVGVLFQVGGKFGLGRLPGDIAIRRGNTSFYFPVITSILISVVLTILANIFLRRR